MISKLSWRMAASKLAATAMITTILIILAESRPAAPSRPSCCHHEPLVESCAAPIDGVLIEDNQKLFDQQLSCWLTKFGFQAVAKVRKRREDS